MKKSLFIIVALLGVCGLSAQTYRNGVWYALYDDTEYTMNTQGDKEMSVFAPTAGTLNVNWRYEWLDWLGIARKIDTQVLESANGGSNTREVGALQENTDKNSNTTEHFSVSRDINWIKYNRQGLPTHKVIIYHQDIRLAQHILLASGEYGTTTGLHDFEVVNIIDTASYKVNLRSFLTAGDITISSSEPSIFHVGAANSNVPLVYAVGANACASKNGNAAAAGGTLGKIDNYAFTIHFTPKEPKVYTAVITLTDGVSTAKITVYGTGYKAPQTDHSYEAAICEGETYPDAYFGDLTEAGIYRDTIMNIAGGDSVITLTLAVNPVYAFKDSLSMRVGDAHTWQNRDLSLLPVADTTLVAAYQTVFGCDSVYTLHLTILPRPTTYGNDTIYLCSGETAVYDGTTYKRPTVDSVLLSTKNQFGGDSIVELVVYVFPKMKMTASLSIYEGDPESWQQIDLSTFPVGDTTLTVTYTSVHGCDSVYVLSLSVLEKPVEPDPVDPDPVDPDTINPDPVDPIDPVDPDPVDPNPVDPIIIDPVDPNEPIGPIEPIQPQLQGLDNTKAVPTATQKIIRNGQVYIRRGEDYYDLLGRKI